MTKRKFGVEVECGSNSFRYNTIARPLRTKASIASCISFPIGIDGSGIEIRTVPLSGAAGFKKLEALYRELLTPRLSCYTAAADGAHVHHDMPEFVKDWDAVENLLFSWRRNEPHILKMLPARRHQRNPWSNLTEPTIKRMIAQAKQRGTPDAGIHYVFGRNLLNIAALEEHGTVEFRGLEGTLNFERVKAWIEFGQHFIENTLAEGKVWSTRGPKSLLNLLEIPKDQQKALLTVGA